MSRYFNKTEFKIASIEISPTNFYMCWFSLGSYVLYSQNAFSFLFFFLDWFIFWILIHF